MGDDIYSRTFAKNLKKYMDLNNKTQIDLVNDLGFTRSAVSTWVNGTRLPRVDKVEALAKYFGIKRSDLTEEKPLIISEDMEILAELDRIIEDLSEEKKISLLQYARYLLYSDMK